MKKTAGNAILLLDEPGLTLHGKAQSDLLKYIQERLLPEHQVIYTTHSPFMIPSNRLADVRVVEDKVVNNNGRPVIKGTKVNNDILLADKGTIFPLQSHLGYEISQTLFIGKNCLLVEGPSDVYYITVFSNALKKLNRKFLDSRWKLCPTGGIDKISAFASLFSGNDLNIAVIADAGKKDKQKIQNLKASQILNATQILTTSDILDQTESEIEDLIDRNLFIRLVNESYNLDSSKSLDINLIQKFDDGNSSIVKIIEKIHSNNAIFGSNFSHFIPADYLFRNPQIIDKSNDSINASLDNFERLFEKIGEFRLD